MEAVSSGVVYGQPKRRRVWVVVGIIGLVVIALIAGLFIWAYAQKASYAQRHKIVYDLPNDVDPNNLTAAQWETIIQDIKDKNKEAYLAGADGSKIPIVQDLTYRQNGEDLTSGMTPPEGEVTIASLDASDLPAGSSAGASNDEGDASSRGGANAPPSNYLEGAGKIFVTPDTYSGSLNGLEGADKICLQQAQRWGLDNESQEWQAILSTSWIDAIERLENKIYVNTKNEVLATSRDGLFNSPTPSLVLTPHGETVDGIAWTGSNKDGGLNVGEEACGNWNSTDGQARYGKPGPLTGGAWLDQNIGSCQEKRHLYCASSKIPDDTNRLSFAFNGSTSDNENEAAVNQKLQDIKKLIKKYYLKAVEVYGNPYYAGARQVNIQYQANTRFYYSPNNDTLYLNAATPQQVVLGLLATFQYRFFTAMPETWKYGMQYTAADVILSQFPEDNAVFFSNQWAQRIRADYEKFNVPHFPIWGARVFYDSDIFSYYDGLMYRVYLASVGMAKPYYHDPQIYAKINTQMYKLDPYSEDLSDDVKMANYLAPFLPSQIDGQSVGEWYANQHVLHQTETNPAYLAGWAALGETALIHQTGVGIKGYTYRTVVTDGGAAFQARPNVPVELTILDDRGQKLHDRDHQTNQYGTFTIENLGDVGIDHDGQYAMQEWWFVKKFYFSVDKELDDQARQGQAPQFLYGVVTNFGTGTATYQSGNVTLEAPIVSGAFKFTGAMAGIVKIDIKNYSGQKVAERTFAKIPGGYFTIIESVEKSYQSGGESNTGSRGGAASGCANLDTSQWLTYSNGYNISYPKDWQKTDTSDSNPESPTQWFLDFGPPNNSTYVSLGTTAENPDDFQTYLKNTTQGLTITKTETAKVGGADAKKYTTKTTGSPYDQYVYYLSTVNTAQIFRGPAASSYFSQCEPEIFEKILTSYNNPYANNQGANQGSSDVHTAAYINAECQFMFEYPSDWAIQSEEYYTTAGGEKALVPTVTLGKASGSSDNQIIINGRQTACDSAPGSSESMEQVGGKNIKIVRYSDGQYCASGEKDGKDKNGKVATYQFVTRYKDTAVKEIFKSLFASFKNTN
jgi:hypothetical protein